jgi:hypothetical protein
MGEYWYIRIGLYWINSKLNPNLQTDSRGSHIAMFTSGKQANHSLKLAQWQCLLTNGCGSHAVMFVSYETCDRCSLTNGGDDYNRVEQGASEGPLHDCFVFRSVPTVWLHRPQQILLECFQPVSHFARPCIFYQHLRPLEQCPQIFCDVDTYLTDITFYLQQWNTIISLLYSVTVDYTTTL